MSYAEFKKIKVHYTDTGQGRVIVMLHGFLGSHEVWAEFIKKLSKSYRVIAIDLPGHGQTPAIGYYHSMELLAQSVKAVLNKAGVRRYIIVGHSMGGYTALAFAELYPENVSGLCLFHSTAYADSEEKKKDRDRVIRLVKNSNVYSFTSADKLLSTGAVSFDAATFEYWGPLLNGGRLVLCSQKTLLDNKLLNEEIKNREVNIMWPKQ